METEEQNVKVEVTEVVLPQEVTTELVNILVTDQKAGLLLKGFLSGKELKGKIALSGEFKLLIDNS